MARPGIVRGVHGARPARRRLGPPCARFLAAARGCGDRTDYSAFFKNFKRGVTVSSPTPSKNFLKMVRASVRAPEGHAPQGPLANGSPGCRAAAGMGAVSPARQSAQRRQIWRPRARTGASPPPRTALGNRSKNMGKLTRIYRTEWIEVELVTIIHRVNLS